MNCARGHLVVTLVDVRRQISIEEIGAGYALTYVFGYSHMRFLDFVEVDEV